MKTHVTKPLSVIFAALLACALLAAPVKAAQQGEEPLTRGQFCAQLVDSLGLTYREEMAAELTDVPADSEYYEAVCVCLRYGVTNVFSSGDFRPEKGLLRSEAASMLARCGLPAAVLETPPADVGNSSWYAEYVRSVVALGIMQVDGENNFNPNSYAYVEEIDFAKFAVLFLPTTTGAVSLDLAAGSITILMNFLGNAVYVQGGNAIVSESHSALVRQNDSGTATANTITVEQGRFDLTISNINSSGPITMLDGVDLTVNMMGDCAVSSLWINGYKSKANLTLEGSGGINADYIEVTDLAISDGTVNLSGYIYAENIAIAGGSVTVKGEGDLISCSDGGTILISGGTVTTETAGNYHGIGSHSTATISITGGTVTAVCKLGSGIYTDNGTVSISGGTVYASGRFWAIGPSYLAGNEHSCGSIVISEDADVTLEYQKYGYGECQERIYYDSILSSAALSGNSALFSPFAHGASGLTYQWQTSPDGDPEGNTWTDVEGQTGAEVHIPMSADNDGHYYRCKLTNGWGNVVYTDPAQAYILAFTQQPQSANVSLADTAALTVKPSCENVTYQWERSYDEGATWTPVSGETYSTLLVNATLSENDALYRCVITATNGDILASDAARITVNSGAVTYTTNYYQQRADGSGYDLVDRVVTEAAAGETVTAVAKSFDHFTEDTAQGVHSGVALADGSLALSRYYDRNRYTLSFETNGGTGLGDISIRYGETLPSLAVPSRHGFIFEGWYADRDLSQAFAFTEMPGENVMAYAKWTAVGADRGIEYELAGITLRSNGYQPISSIPAGSFYAEVSVKNRSSTTMDTLVLASYDKNGRLLDLNFLYANPQIGQTFTLGALLDDSDGEIYKLKAFMLPMLGGAVPLGNVAELIGGRS